MPRHRSDKILCQILSARLPCLVSAHEAQKGWCDMNNMIKKMMMTGIACVALCGTTLAAPAHNTRPMPKGKAPMVQVAKPMPKPAPHKTIARPMPTHHTTPHHVHTTHRLPPRPVTPCHHHHHHGHRHWCPPPPPPPHHHCHNWGWCPPPPPPPPRVVYVYR